MVIRAIRGQKIFSLPSLISVVSNINTLLTYHSGNQSRTTAVPGLSFFTTATSQELGTRTFLGLGPGALLIRRKRG